MCTSYSTWCVYVCACVCVCAVASAVASTRKAATGWWDPIECLEVQVSFRKRATNHRALLQKMTYKDEASYASSPPCSRKTPPSFPIYELKNASTTLFGESLRWLLHTGGVAVRSICVAVCNVRKHAYTWIFMYTYTYIRMHTYIHLHIFKYVCIHIYVYEYIYICIHIHICIYTYINM